MKRQHVAHFLFGFFTMPVCALLGGMEAMLFRWTHGRALACVAFCVLFPLVGAIASRQRILTLGLLAGAAATATGYFLLR
ncbi:MAG: hypothetical protein ACLQVD_06535 [Capsulimonadaceae bacterium]